MTLHEAFNLNPKVLLSKGTVAPFVDMSTVQPFTRDVRATVKKAYSGGTKFLNGDVLMARITPSLENGKTSIYRATPGFIGPAFGSTEFIVIRGREGVSDSLFAYYIFTSHEVREHAISSMNGSSGRQRVQHDSLATFEFDLPPLDEQRSIAATLGALDDKIESNQRKLRLVDDLFQAKWRKVSSRTTTSRRLGDLVSTQYGLTASASVETEGPRFLRVTDINKANWVSWSSVPSANITETDWRKYRLTKGDLLVARMADPGKSAIYDEESVDAVFASYLVRLKAGSYAESLYLYGFLKSELYADYAAGATTGSVQKNMNAKVIVDVGVPWPDVSEIDSFAISTAPLRAAINQLVRECDDLRTLRDALLPELLAGRLRVPESHENSHEVSA